MEQFSSEGRPRRREYSKAFKAQLVAACAQPGASVGGVALSHGLHANMVHRWIREAGPVRAQPGVGTDAEPGFISLPLSYEMAILKRLKFAAKTEALNADQRSLLEDALEEDLQGVRPQRPKGSTTGCESALE